MGAILLIIAIAGGIYGYSLWRHPYTPCKRCRGGDVNNPIWRTAFGNCWKCGGRGQFPRLGVRIFMHGTAKAISARKHGRNY